MGTSLDAYERFLRIGRGGMAEVWLAVRKGPAGFRKLMVVKQLHAELASDPMFVSMFLDEARLAAELSHPNIVQTLEVGGEGQDLFLVMEYLEGQTLRSIRERCRLPVAVEVAICRDVLRALEYAHDLRGLSGSQLGIVHRDISPDNIFVTYDGMIKLVDFGVAKAASARTPRGSGMYKGKLTYMAPEQAVGGDVDRRADLFSVGAVLWEALAGRRLWGPASHVAILGQLSAGKIPELPPEVLREHPDLATICSHAMAPDVARRFASARVFHNALEHHIARQGWRVDSRTLGNFMLEQFGEERTRMRLCVEAELSKLRSRGTQELPGVAAFPRIEHAKRSPLRAPSKPPAQVGGRYVLRQRVSLSGPEIYDALDPRTRTPLWVELHHGLRFEALQPRLRQLCEIRHPVLSSPLDAGPLSHGSGSFVAWQRPEGIALRQALSGGPPTVLDAVDVVAELARAMVPAHRIGLFHGDLGARCVLLSDGAEPRTVRLFGMALDPPALDPVVPGPAADVRALGALLNELLAAALAPVAQPGADLAELLAAHEPLVALVDELAGNDGLACGTAESLLSALHDLDRAELAERFPSAGGWNLAMAAGHLPKPMAAWRQPIPPDPTIWLLTRDPALRSPTIRAGLSQTHDLGTLRLLDDISCVQSAGALQRGEVPPPSVVVFGDLDVLLNNPLLAVLRDIPEVSRVVVSSHANAEMLQVSANQVGLDQQVCLPCTPEEVSAALHAAVARSGKLRRVADELRETLLESRCHGAATAMGLTSRRNTDHRTPLPFASGAR